MRERKREAWEIAFKKQGEKNEISCGRVRILFIIKKDFCELFGLYIYIYLICIHAHGRTVEAMPNS